MPIYTSPNIISFLFGVCPSVLLQISTLPFLAVAPLLHNPIFHLSLHWVEMYTAKRAGMYPTITLIGPSVLCWRSIPTTGPEHEGASYSGWDDPLWSLLIYSWSLLLVASPSHPTLHLYGAPASFWCLLLASPGTLTFFVVTPRISLLALF